MRTFNGLLLLLTVVVIACGCAVYHPNPLTEEAVNRALQVPDIAELSIAVDSLQHGASNPLSIDLTDGLSSDEAAVIALLENPTLRAERDRRGLADAQLLQARILPDPTIDAGLDLPSGGTREGSVKGSTVGLGWDASSLITRSARIREAKRGRESIQLDVAWQEWQVVQETRIAVFRLATLQRQVVLAQETDVNLSENVDAVRKALKEGVMTELNLSAAEAASNQAHSQYLALKLEATRQRFQLLRVMGLPADTPLTLEQGVEAPNQFSPPSVDSLVQGVQQRRLDLVALRRGYAAQEERVRAAILAQFPGIQLGANKATDTGNLISSGLGVSINIPFFDRNRGEISLERATRRMLFDEYTSRVYEALSDIATLHTTVLSINDQIAAAEKTIPSLEKLVETYRNAVRERQADILSYYNAWNELTSKRIELLSLRQNLVEARFALEIAAGIYQQDRVAPFISLPATPEGTP
jgi:cobalt-zinc-cadmium efflux system outer membrane protein